MRRYGYIIFVYGLPFLILLVVNIGIVKKLIETKRRKRDLLCGAMSTTVATNPLLLDTAAAAGSGHNGSSSGQFLLPNSNGRHSNSANGGGGLGESHATSHSLGHGLARNKATSVSKKSMSMLRSSLASGINIDPRITLMVMAIVLAFFLCQFPYLVVNILFSSNHANTLGFHIAKIGYCIKFLTQ